MVIPSPKPWTYELYSLLPEDGRRHEIIGGEHYVTPAPKTRHQRIVHRLGFELESALRNEGVQGDILAAPCDVRLSETDVVQPDLLFVTAARLDIVTDIGVDGAPDLVVEVLSESTRKRDEVLKRNLYERYAVLEYWIVDPESETVKVFRLGADGAYGAPALLDSQTGEALTTPMLHDLAIRLTTLFK